MTTLKRIREIIAARKDQIIFLEASQARFKEIPDWASVYTSERIQERVQAELACYECMLKSQSEEPLKILAKNNEPDTQDDSEYQDWQDRSIPSDYNERQRDND